MSALETMELDDQKYHEWLAGREERIAERKARRLGNVAIKLEGHAPQNPQTIVDEAIHHGRQEHVEEALVLIGKTDDLLQSLDSVLATAS